MTARYVLVAGGDRVKEITLNRPEKRNAINVDLRDELILALRGVLSDPQQPRIALFGAGPCFCSGGDLTEFGRTQGRIEGHLGRIGRSLPWLMMQLADRVVCAVHGACMGAGLELASFARRVIAAEDAFFSLPEVGMGLIPGMGGTVSVQRRIGRPAALSFMLTGATMDAEQARRCGLVDEVVPRNLLRSRAMEAASG